MSIADILKEAGSGLAKGAKAAGAVLEPLGQRTAEVVSGEAPQIDEERRQQAEKGVEAKAQELESQLEMGRKYGTLTPGQQKQYVDAITQLYSHPSQMGTLVQKLHKAVHPGGATYQAPPLTNATPNGGTAATDEARALELAQARRPMKEYQSPDGKSKDWFQPGTEPEGWQATAGGGSTRPVPYYSGAMSLDTANQMQSQQGMAFEGPDGQPYDLKTLPPGSVLIPVYESGGKHYWTVATDKGRYETAGNQRMLEPSVGAPNPQAPSIGTARVGTVTTQTSPGGGQVVTQTSTPRTTPAAVLPRSGPPSTGAQPVVPRSVGSALPRKTADQSQSILPNIQGMTPHNAAMAQKAQPAVSALLGIYGDPQNPSVPSLMNYAKMANDPHAQKVLGEAFKLLDQQMGEISDPGLIQTLGTAAGWANFRAQAEAGAQQQAGTEMTSQEREYFDAAIASMADIIGARAATGQSPARFSVKAMQNELPLIGLSGTPDMNSYLTKLETIGRQVAVGLNAMPDNSRALAWLARRQAEIQNQKGKVASALGGQKPIVQHSPSTGKYRYSVDGGKTWQPGQPPQQ
jgi:hypothetical protein